MVEHMEGALADTRAESDRIGEVLVKQNPIVIGIAQSQVPPAWVFKHPELPVIVRLDTATAFESHLSQSVQLGIAISDTEAKPRLTAWQVLPSIENQSRLGAAFARSVQNPVPKSLTNENIASSWT